MSGYPVPVGDAEVELRFKNSRFIGSAAPAASVAEAKEFIQSVRARFPDASHHCYTYAAGFGATVTHGMSDDGEPSGTAGRPMLAVVQGAGIGDVAVVATRYFGGTKLGTGGLVKAYTVTTQEVLAAVKVVQKIDTVLLNIALAYDSYAPCRKRIEEAGAEVEEEQFGGDVVLRVRVDVEHMEALRSTLIDMTAGRAQVDLVV